MAPDALRLSPNGATLEVDSILREPLKLTLGQLHLAQVDRGPAKVRGEAGRFPILRRLSATAVVPRDQGIEGWLWTSIGGSALTLAGRRGRGARPARCCSPSRSARASSRRR